MGKTIKKVRFALIDGRKQIPRDNDFNITPSIVFSYVTPYDTDGIGYAFGLAIAFGFWMIGIKFLFAYKDEKLKTNNGGDSES